MEGDGERRTKLFAYPKSLGEYKKEVQPMWGKYSFYLKHGEKNISIPKPDNTIENDGANRSDEVKKQEPINPKYVTLKENFKKIIADSFKAYKEHQLDYVDDKGTTITITVRKGQYGPYFNYQGKRYSIYKTYDADNLSAEDVKKILSYKKKGTSTKSVIGAKKNEEVKLEIEQKKVEIF